MVARIRTGKSLRGAVNYNENKVKEGSAVLLMASGYPKDADALNFHEKVSRLQRLADLNTRTTVNCVHISLNFDVTEKLSQGMLEAIAQTYMEKIGFGNQPYLVYQHHDAAHDHIHVVTTNIQKDGKRISLHNLGSVQSEKARKEIEVQFGLVKAGDKQQNKLQPLKPVSLEKAVYGKIETHRAIKNIVTSVVSQYRFGSLHELNAVLKLFNVMADRGGENSRIYEKNGLQYTLINEKGEKVGIPLKASSIYGKPTMANLEKQYEPNKELRGAYKQDIKNAIDKVLQEPLTGEWNLATRLKEHDVDIVLRKNTDGFIYGVTYVDHNTKSVFNGSELGKQYSAAIIREVLNKNQQIDSVIDTRSKPERREEHPGKQDKTGNDEGNSWPFLKQPSANESKEDKPASIKEDEFSLLKIISDPVQESSYLPWQLKRKKKKRKPWQHL